MTRTVVLFVALVVLVTAQSSSAAKEPLPRINKASIEPLTGLETSFDELVTPERYRLRTIRTRPSGTKSNLPAIYFVQWLSCDSIEIGKSDDGWTQMIRSLVAESGMVVVRTEKVGVGDSVGAACSALDYETELRHHRLALGRVFDDPWVDRNRVLVFGASMGANFAPLVAAGHKVKAVATWGGGTQSWFERQLGFERRNLELSGKSGVEIDRRMRDLARFYAAYLLDGQTPQQISQREPKLGAVWSSVTGSDGVTQFGRPIAFHQQAQRRHWAGAWAAVDAPVLALFGEYDWYESREGVSLIGTVRKSLGRHGTDVRFIEGLDHHFTRYRSMQDAYDDKGGVPDARSVMSILLPWFKKNAK